MRTQKELDEMLEEISAQQDWLSYEWDNGLVTRSDFTERYDRFVALHQALQWVSGKNEPLILDTESM